MRTLWRVPPGSRVDAARTILISVLLMVAGMVQTSTATAFPEQAECERRLLTAPIEAAALPPGWEWQFLRLGEYGWPLMPSPASWYGGVGRSGESFQLGVRLFLSCQADTDLLLERVAAVALGSGATKLEVDPIGDGSVAFVGGSSGQMVDMLMEGAPSVMWRNGDVLGRVIVWGYELDLAALEAFARSVSDVLVEAGGTSATSGSDACVRRLLEAPIETLEGSVSMALTAFPGVVPTWVGVMPGKLPWSTPSFHLSCQPDAALLMERAVEVQKRSRAADFDARMEIRDLEPIGDGSIAFEWFESSAGKSEGITILWRNGDAFGEIQTGSRKFASAEAFARSVSGLLETAGPVPTMTLSDREADCVKRLLDAPIETLDDWEKLWYDLDLGMNQIAPVWESDPFFELSCQANADLILDLLAEEAIEAGQVEVDIGPIGDATFASGTPPEGKWPTVVWRNGDVLGRAYLGSSGELGQEKLLRAVTGFARRVNSLLE